MVLDADLGPLVLELNARPGLAIQIANGRGLRGTLDAIDKADLANLDPAARAALIRSIADSQSIPV
jgi:hypothetical protein